MPIGRWVSQHSVRPQNRQPANAASNSVHPAGMAVDLRIPDRGRCRSWLEQTLLSLEGSGVLDVTRERWPPHYHVAVFTTPYQNYVAALADRQTIQHHRGADHEAKQPQQRRAGSQSDSPDYSRQFELSRLMRSAAAHRSTNAKISICLLTAIYVA